MALPMLLHADPFWSSSLVAATPPPGHEPIFLEDPTADAPDNATLARTLCKHAQELPLPSRLLLFVRCYCQMLLTAVAAFIVVVLSTSAAFMVHMFMVWLSFHFLSRVGHGPPPFAVFLMLHVPALRVSAWLGALLARALMDGVAERNRAWRMVMMADLVHHLEMARLALEQRRVSSGRRSSTAAVAVPGGGEPVLFPM